MIKDFFAGLQFLTRISLIKETEWSNIRFGNSVSYFPLVGAIIGLLLAGIYYLGNMYLSRHFLCALLIVAEIVITGGLHCDGYMDTADGVFSGRGREKMLEIMKDSRVGSNGVVAFVMLVLMKWSLYLDMSHKFMLITLYSAPIIGRLAMVMVIVCFPYARPEGLGKLFKEYTSYKTLIIATGIGVLLLLLINKLMLISAIGSIFFAYLFAKNVSAKLGGLTGDVYGATTELTELTFMLIATIINSII